MGTGTNHVTRRQVFYRAGQVGVGGKGVTAGGALTGAGAGRLAGAGCGFLWAGLGGATFVGAALATGTGAFAFAALAFSALFSALASLVWALASTRPCSAAYSCASRTSFLAFLADFRARLCWARISSALAFAALAFRWRSARLASATCSCSCASAASLLRSSSFISHSSRCCHLRRSISSNEQRGQLVQLFYASSRRCASARARRSRRARLFRRAGAFPADGKDTGRRVAPALFKADALDGLLVQTKRP